MEDSAIALDVVGVFFNTFMSLTFGVSSSCLSLDMNVDRCVYLPVEITVLNFLVTFKVNGHILKSHLLPVASFMIMLH